MHLWDTMVEVWPILKIELIIGTNEEWLPHLLSLHPYDVRDMIIMLIWRIWHLRNESNHGKDISQWKHQRFSCVDI